MNIKRYNISPTRDFGISLEESVDGEFVKADDHYTALKNLEKGKNKLIDELIKKNTELKEDLDGMYEDLAGVSL